MHRRELLKPDGRRLLLYSRRPIADGIVAPVPPGERLRPNPHMRWHPLRGEWVAYAAYRQNRTFLPPADFNPLRPAVGDEAPTELPPGDYDVAVFENAFPTFVASAHDAPPSILPTAPANGTCEVVVYTQDPHASLGSLPLDHVALLVDVWADRTAELGSRDDVAYVFPFENRGVEVGVTLHHPHGQIYAYPFVPPVMARELACQLSYHEDYGRGLLEDHTLAELEDGRRILYRGEHAVAYVPACSRYAYEVWVLPERPVAFLGDLSPDERLDFARALKTVLLKLDGLWNLPMPLIMTFRQAPTDGRPHPEAHAHVQLYPAYRMKGRLKFLAGSEIGAGVFTADTLPEDKAAELQAVQVEVEST